MVINHNAAKKSLNAEILTFRQNGLNEKKFHSKLCIFK